MLSFLLGTKKKKKQQIINDYNIEVLNITLDSNKHAIAQNMFNIIRKDNIVNIKGMFSAISYINRLQNDNNKYVIDLFDHKLTLQYQNNKLIDIKLIDVD